MVDLVRPSELTAWFAQAPGGQPLVLDVREPWELARAAVAAGAFELLAIPMGQLPPSLPKSTPSAPSRACATTVCAASMWLRTMSHHGCERVANITGGIDAWSQRATPAFRRY
jgi:rhodanese-related sulfurtransferase